QNQIDAVINEYQTIAAASAGTVDVGPLVDDLREVKGLAAAEQQVLEPLVSGQVSQQDLGQVGGAAIVVSGSDLPRIEGSTVIAVAGDRSFDNRALQQSPCDTGGANLLFTHTGDGQPVVEDKEPVELVFERVKHLFEDLIEHIPDDVSGLVSKSNTALGD